MRHRLLLITTVALLCRAHAVSAGAGFELRLAADSNLDRRVAKAARASNSEEVFLDGLLVARWVPVAEAVASGSEATNSLVTRRSDSGRTSLLVLIGPNDVTERDISYLSGRRHRPNGPQLLGVHFNDNGSRRLANLTSQNLGRRLAQIVDAEVSSIVTIHTVLSEYAVVLGVSGPMVGDVLHKWEKRGFKTVVSLDGQPGYSPAFKVLVPAGITVLIGFVALTLRLAGLRMRNNSQARNLAVVCCALGALTGAYLLGFEVSRQSPDDLPPGIVAVGKTYTVKLLEGAVGTVVGVVTGFIVSRGVALILGWPLWKKGS